MSTISTGSPGVELDGQIEGYCEFIYVYTRCPIIGCTQLKNVFRSSDRVEKLQKKNYVFSLFTKVSAPGCTEASMSYDYSVRILDHVMTSSHFCFSASFTNGRNESSCVDTYFLHQSIYTLEGAGASRRDFRKKTCPKNFSAHVWTFSKQYSCRFRLQCYRYIRRVIKIN